MFSDSYTIFVFRFGWKFNGFAMTLIMSHAKSFHYKKGKSLIENTSHNTCIKFLLIELVQIPIHVFLSSTHVKV